MFQVSRHLEEMLYVRVHVQSLQSCLTLCDPMYHSPPGSSVHGILQARILEWVAMASSRGSSQPRDWTQVSSYLLHCKQILYHWASREAQRWCIYTILRRPPLMQSDLESVCCPYHLLIQVVTEILHWGNSIISYILLILITSLKNYHKLSGLKYNEFSYVRVL